MAGSDWKSTLNLPKTEFAMRADLARREPQWLARWAAERQYERILQDRLENEARRSYYIKELERALNYERLRALKSWWENG